MDKIYYFEPGDEVISIDKALALMTVKNSQTGATRTIPYYDSENTEFRNKWQMEKARKHFQRLQEREQDQRGPFVIAKTGPNKELEDREDLTITYRRYFMLMLPYAQFDGKPFSKNGVPLGNKDFAKLWGISEVNTKKALSRLVNLGLIFRKKDEQDKRKSNYFLSNSYFLKGKGILREDKFVKVFQRKLSEVINKIKELENEKNKNPKIKNKVDFKDVIGLIHAILPYFHFETYYLVSNPDEPITLENESILDALERNPQALKHLSKSHIGRILGHKNADRRTIDKYFNILQCAGALMVTRAEKKTRYLIHPDLMFRLDSSGHDEYTRYVRAQYHQHSKNKSGEAE